MEWARAEIANRSKFLQRCNGSDRGLRSGLASMWCSFNSLGDMSLPSIEAGEKGLQILGFLIVNLIGWAACSLSERKMCSSEGPSGVHLAPALMNQESPCLCNEVSGVMHTNGRGADRATRADYERRSLRPLSTARGCPPSVSTGCSGAADHQYPGLHLSRLYHTACPSRPQPGPGAQRVPGPTRDARPAHFSPLHPLGKRS